MTSTRRIYRKANRIDNQNPFVSYRRAMSESFIQNLFAERIGGAKYGKSTAIYKFEKIKRAKRAAMAAHPEVELIDMGVGEPDEMAFPLDRKSTRLNSSHSSVSRMPSSA